MKKFIQNGQLVDSSNDRTNHIFGRLADFFPDICIQGVLTGDDRPQHNGLLGVPERLTTSKSNREKRI